VIEIFADPDQDPGLYFSKNFRFFTSKKYKRPLDPDQHWYPDLDPGTLKNAGPDSGTPKTRIQYGSEILFLIPEVFSLKVGWTILPTPGLILTTEDFLLLN